MEERLRAGLSACRHLPGVADARALGAIGVLEMEAPVDVERLQAYCIREHSVWIRPFGRLIYIMPPYVISPDELDMLTRAMRDAVERGVWRKA
jgi:adenosylmethionine-8-amino-7-oxononanoate aminotransferase